MAGLAVVVADGLALVTTTGSAPHGLVAGLLLISPEYSAVQFQVPTEVGTNPMNVPVATGVTTSVKAAGPV